MIRFNTFLCQGKHLYVTFLCFHHVTNAVCYIKHSVTVNQIVEVNDPDFPIFTDDDIVLVHVAVDKLLRTVF